MGIPKIIHYCWFGGNPLPELAQKCIASWEKYCPDYEIIRWDESNFDLNYNDYVREAYEAKKWAFVSDVARLYALVNYGGIYMDTDTELLKPLDGLLHYEAVAGFESETHIAAGLMGCQAGQELIFELLHDYDGTHFIRPDGSYDLTTIVVRITDICQKYSFIPNNTLQTVKGFTLLPKDYLYPMDYITRGITTTDRTLALHHYAGSWLSEDQQLAQELFVKYKKYMPERAAGYLSAFASIKRTKGLKEALYEVMAWKKRKREKNG